MLYPLMSWNVLREVYWLFSGFTERKLSLRGQVFLQKIALLELDPWPAVLCFVPFTQYNNIVCKLWFKQQGSPQNQGCPLNEQSCLAGSAAAANVVLALHWCSGLGQEEGEGIPTACKFCVSVSRNGCPLIYTENSACLETQGSFKLLLQCKACSVSSF